jgi:hypothetical protein
VPLETSELAAVKWRLRSVVVLQSVKLLWRYQFSSLWHLLPLPPFDSYPDSHDGRAPLVQDDF